MFGVGRCGGREDELDFAEIGGETGASTHDARIADPWHARQAVTTRQWHHRSLRRGSVRYQTAEPKRFTHLAGFEPGTRKMSLLSVESYMTLGGQLRRPGSLTGRSAVVPMTINLVALSEWIVSASANGISTVAPVIE